MIWEALKERRPSYRIIIIIIEQIHIHLRYVVGDTISSDCIDFVIQTLQFDNFYKHRYNSVGDQTLGGRK